MTSIVQEGWEETSAKPEPFVETPKEFWCVVGGKYVNTGCHMFSATVDPITLGLLRSIVGNIIFLPPIGSVNVLTLLEKTVYDGPFGEWHGMSWVEIFGSEAEVFAIHELVSESLVANI